MLYIYSHKHKVTFIHASHVIIKVYEKGLSKNGRYIHTYI